MKTKFSLRTILIFSMLLIISIHTLVFISSLYAANVFYMIDSNEFKVFNTTIENQVQKFNKDSAKLISSVGETSLELSDTLLKTSDKFKGGTERYDDTMFAGGNVIIDTLKNNHITGAFFILDNSNPDVKEFLGADNTGSVYIRTTTPGVYDSSPNNMIMEAGSVNLLKKLGIVGAVNWPHDELNYKNLKNEKFFTKPIVAAKKFKGSEIQRFGYWNEPFDILRDQEEVILYTLPLLDRYGNPFGIVGIEIETSFFGSNYVFSLESPYEKSFYLVGEVKDDYLKTDWSVTQNLFGQHELSKMDKVELSAINKTGVSAASLGKMGEMYCSTKPLVMYSRNSPFYKDAWSFVGFVPKNTLHSSSKDVRLKIWTTLIASVIFSIICILFFAYLSTKRISTLTESLKNVSYTRPVSFEQIGFKEIDELTTTLEILNRDIINSSKTLSNILEMSLLPIGGYEIRHEYEDVNLTDYIYELLDINSDVSISKAEWDNIYKDLTINPTNFENVYCYEKEGNYIYLRIHEKPTEMGVAGAIVDVSENIKEQLNLRNQLEHDALTGLYNRTAFYMKVEELIKQDPEMIGAMIFADLDNLKYVNDTYGHEVGDRLIIKASERFKTIVELGAIAARISGDEFAIFMYGFDNRESLLKTIEKTIMDEEISYIAVSGGEKVAVRFSAGISWYPKDGTNIRTLLKYADFAMYEAKKNEKGAIYEFDYGVYSQNKYILENNEMINTLIANELIHFVFQPIVSLKDGSIYSYEALMRSSLENFKNPLDILNVAKYHSKLKVLERLVFKIAFKTISEHENEIKDSKIFINSIPNYMIEFKELQEYKKMYPIDFGRLVIEVTETKCDSLINFSKNVSRIRDSGIQFAIDDFGKGHSGELRVLNLNPDIIKIDMDLVQGISKDVRKRELLLNLIEFYHARDIIIIAEGIEEREDLEVLVELGVDLAQGYYLSKPAEEFKSLDEEKFEELKQIIKSKSQI